MQWHVASAIEDSDELSSLLIDGWEPFAVVREPEVNDRGYHIGDVNRVFLKCHSWSTPQRQRKEP